MTKETTETDVSAPYKVSGSFPADLVVCGKFIMHQKEHKKWEKDGVQREMDVDCVYLLDGENMLIVRVFNPSFDLNLFPVGSKVYIPVQEYRKENGLKTFVARI